MILEIAAFCIEDALIAQDGGADRIELCSNYDAGGITCSTEILQKVRSKITIPIFPIIRPRAGGFCYNDEEFNEMKKAILLCKKIGYNGIVTGILDADKTIDIQRTSELVALANPLPVTFHRAFDETTKPLTALEDIINCGCKRVLTSGQQKTAFQGKDLIKQLIIQANNRIVIMPGGGVRSNHIMDLHLTTNAFEFHSAAQNISVKKTDIIEAKKLAQYIHSTC